MSNDAVNYYRGLQCNCSYEFEINNYRSVTGNLTNVTSKTSKTCVSLMIVVICLWGGIAATNAKVPEFQPWSIKQSITDFGGNIIFRNYSGPSFGKVPDSIEVMPGQTVVLSCIVNNLGDRTVSWIRTADLHILTSGSITFTGDNRFSTEPTDDILSNCWGLMIRNTQYTDSGNYECQVNTEPKLKINVTLIVREQQLMDRPFDGTTIDGPRKQEIKRGSTITLTCRATISSGSEENNKIVFSRNEDTHRPRRVIWSVNNIPMTLQINRGGINIYTDWSINEVMSNLTLTSVTNEDRGTYKCSIDGIGSDEVALYVMNDSKTADFVVASSPITLHLISLLFLMQALVYITNYNYSRLH